jgi:hypothetical protein
MAPVGGSSSLSGFGLGKGSAATDRLDKNPTPSPTRFREPFRCLRAEMASRCLTSQHRPLERRGCLPVIGAAADVMLSWYVYE